jgi:hypothetical protein
MELWASVFAWDLLKCIGDYLKGEGAFYVKPIEGRVFHTGSTVVGNRKSYRWHQMASDVL